jgi:hypothetical protein
MKLMDNIKLLFCFNEAGHEKINEILNNLLHNSDYMETTPEQYDIESKAKREQEEREWKEQETAKEAEKEKLKEKFAHEFLATRRVITPYIENEAFLKAVDAVFNSSYSKIRKAFDWGYIQGKRAERTRKKKVSL